MPCLFDAVYATIYAIVTPLMFDATFHARLRHMPRHACRCCCRLIIHNTRYAATLRADAAGTPLMLLLMFRYDA